MQPGVVRCPGCGVTVKIPSSTAQAYRCPKCTTVLTSATQSGPAAPTPNSRVRPDSNFGANTGFRGSSSARTAPRNQAEILLPQPFLKRLAIVLAVLSGIIVVLGLIGLKFEIAAMASAAAGVVAAMALAVVGQFWITSAAFRESVGQGLMVLFVPLYQSYYAATRKGPSWKGLLLIVSALAPVSLSLLVLLMLAPTYSAEGRATARLEQRQSSAERMKTLILNVEASADRDAPARTAVYKCLGNPSRIPSRERVNQALGEFDSYVAGSAEVDRTERTITFRYRGPQKLENMLRLYLGPQVEIFLAPR